MFVSLGNLTFTVKVKSQHTLNRQIVCNAGNVELLVSPELKQDIARCLEKALSRIGDTEIATNSISFK